MYVESRKVNNFDDLLALIVCDRVKSTLSENCLRYILSVENASQDGWLKVQQLAEAVDLYKTSHFNDRPHASAIGFAARSSVSNACDGNKSGPGTRFRSGPQPQSLRHIRQQHRSVVHRSAEFHQWEARLAPVLYATNACNWHTRKFARRTLPLRSALMLAPLGCNRLSLSG